MEALSALHALFEKKFDWAGWELLIRQNGFVIDRAYRSPHPVFPEIRYPIDYGYIRGTIGTEGDEVDLFVGSAANGLVGLLLTADHRRGDREAKLLYNCTPEEVYLAHGFINFDPARMEGRLVLRRPMHALWEDA